MAYHTVNHSLSKKIRLFFKIANNLSATHPELVVISFHEYFRNLYLIDPYIKKEIIKILKKFRNSSYQFDKLLYSGKKLGSYLSYKKNKIFREDVETGELFGTLWQDRMNNKSLNSLPILKGLFKRANFNIKKLKNKTVLDMGCGSGRFTTSLAKLGVKKAFGVDKGRAGLKIAKKYAKKNKIKNLQYKNASVLNLPFKNERFDFVFCKGVLHHTGNLKKGLNEFYRVMKKNGEGFLYLYGSGGIFWNSRKLMRNIMKKIPYKKAFKILKTIEMPARRTIFLDSWYVEIEEHVNKKFLKNLFNKKKLKFFKYNNPLKTELEYLKKYKYFKEMYGSGELRYFVQK